MKFVFCLPIVATLTCGVSALSASKGATNLAKWRKNAAIDPVSAGGWHKVTELANDPKSKLIALLKESVESEGNDTQKRAYGGKEGEFDVLVNLLEAQGKGYDSSLVDGEWLLVVSKNNKKSPKAQKALGKMEKFGSALSNFDVKGGTFENIASTPRGNGALRAKLTFSPVGDNFSKIDDKIILRRVECMITGANFKYWKLPRLPLPFRSKGYLDFVYLDNDIRITRGNKGGLFIHVREGVL